jgi:hypothetical protein
LVVHGDVLGMHLKRALALARLGVRGLVLDDLKERDRWVFGGAGLRRDGDPFEERLLTLP